MLPACRALLLFALLALCTGAQKAPKFQLRRALGAPAFLTRSAPPAFGAAARPFKRAPLQHGAHFVVLEEHTDSLREVAEHFKVDLEDLLDYNQQIKGTDVDTPLKPGTTIHLPSSGHSNGWDEGWDGLGWEKDDSSR
jgi:hypothetical protein